MLVSVYLQYILAEIMVVNLIAVYMCAYVYLLIMMQL